MFRKFYACVHMFVCVSESESKGWDQASVSVLWVHFKDVCVWVCSAPRHMCMSYSFSTAYWPLTLTAIARPCYNCPFEPPVASVAPKGGSLRACVCVCMCVLLSQKTSHGSLILSWANRIRGARAKRGGVPAVSVSWGSEMTLGLSRCP